MKLLIFAAGVLTGLAFSRIPHIGPWFHDQPITPADFEPKYAIGGRYVSREEFEAHDWLNEEVDWDGFEMESVA